MRVVVGYQDTKSGRDALALGARMVAASGGELHVVLVLASNERATLAPPEVGYTRYLEKAALEWLAGSQTWLAEHAFAEASTHLTWAESGAEGLLESARELDAALIVVGAARGGIAGRFRISGVANALLHAAEVPVALAPKKSRTTAGSAVPRVTAAIGLRPGASDVMTSAIRLADALGSQLRLLSLVAIDQDGLRDPAASDAAGAAAHAHVTSVLEGVKETLPTGVAADTLVAQGSTFEEAVVKVDFSADELVVVGSSRLASAGRLFLGATAARMLRELPVPMVVVPRDAALGE